MLHSILQPVMMLAICPPFPFKFRFVGINISLFFVFFKCAKPHLTIVPAAKGAVLSMNFAAFRQEKWWSIAICSVWSKMCHPLPQQLHNTKHLFMYRQAHSTWKSYLETFADESELLHSYLWNICLASPSFAIRFAAFQAIYPLAAWKKPLLSGRQKRFFT